MCFQSYDKLTNIMCETDDPVKTGSVLYHLSSVTADGGLIDKGFGANRKGRGFISLC